MDRPADEMLIYMACAGFMSKISASMSHELSNSIAVLYEKAGLIEDLVTFGGNQAGDCSERISGITCDIIQYIDKTEAIIGKLNKFAHSPDESITQFEASQAIEFYIALTERIMAINGIVIIFKKNNETNITSIRLNTFLNLLWICTEMMTELVPSVNIIIETYWLDEKSSLEILFIPENTKIDDIKPGFNSLKLLQITNSELHLKNGVLALEIKV